MFKRKEMVIIQLFILLFIISNLIYGDGSVKVIGKTNTLIQNFKMVHQRGDRNINLSLPDGDSINVEIKHFTYNDDYLSISGNVLGVAESEFVLRGTKEDVYGWIHLFAESLENGTVYKYSTDFDKNVFVEEALVTDIIKINNSNFPEDDVYIKRSEYIDDNLPEIVFMQPMPDNLSLHDLQSKPEADKVLWMDIRDLMDGEEPITYSREDIFLIWQVVSTGFSTYRVNVTTSKDVFDATAEQDRGIGLFHNRDGRSHCAYDMFGTTADCELFLEANGFFGGRSALHEYGHLLGLDDQGTGLNGVQWATYFPGYDELKWVPIMGNYLYSDDWGDELLYQWSDGNYKAGTQAVGMPQEDVLSIMTDYLQVEPDDNPTSKPLIIKDGNLSVIDNYGMINIVIDGQDEDDFTFEITEAGGEIDITIDRIGNIGGAMLDVHASLLDESGYVVTEDSPNTARYANIQSTLNPGNYTLRVKGIGEKNSDTEEFSNYGSIGYFGISGTIENASVDVAKSIKGSNSKSIVRNGNIINFNGLTSNDKSKISIYSISGKRLFEKTLKGNGKVQLENFIGKGCYILNISGNTTNYKEHFIISN